VLLPKKREPSYRKFGRGKPSPSIAHQRTVETKRTIINSTTLIPSVAAPASQRVEFFRLPAPGKRDPHFGLSRGWYYKAAALGEIKLVAIRQRGALRGVRLIAYDSVMDYIRCSMGNAADTSRSHPVVS